MASELSRLGAFVLLLIAAPAPAAAAAPSPGPQKAPGTPKPEAPKPEAPKPETQRPLSVKRGSAQALAPFWKSRPESRRRVREEREVLFLVNKSDLSGGRSSFSIRGAGLVSAPKDFAFKAAQEYGRLAQVSSHFREAKWDPATKTLFLIAEALGYQARMILRIEAASEDWRSELQWEVIWGPFQGMSGVVAFEDAGAGKTETSMESTLATERLPLPKVLMGFALEVVAQKVAEKMRAHLEAEWKARGSAVRGSVL